MDTASLRLRRITRRPSHWMRMVSSLCGKPSKWTVCSSRLRRTLNKVAICISSVYHYRWISVKLHPFILK
uniref:Uncharacterized protein n=1 Tax=Parascaris equorum TaxID=6256 RepID=A0A914RS77_PAREQ